MDAIRFKERFLPYHRRIYNTAFRMLGNAQDAEDMVQETYIRLWERRSELDAIANDESFCITIVRNLTLDKIRKTRYDTGDVTDDHLLLPDGNASPAELVEHKDSHRLLCRLIDKLPQIQRHIILLHDANGYSYDEIEKITGLTPVNIRVSLSRARKKLREQFEKYLSHGNK